MAFCQSHECNCASIAKLNSSKVRQFYFLLFETRFVRMFRGAAVLSARLCAALLVIVALGFATAPAAQATPHGGWNGTYPTARDACYAFWAYWHLPLPHPGYSRFTGAFPTDDPNVQRCHWTHYQDASCPYGPWGCTTIPPGTVAFACDSGYHRSLDDRCVEDQPPERPLDARQILPQAIRSFWARAPNIIRSRILRPRTAGSGSGGNTAVSSAAGSAATTSLLLRPISAGSSILTMSCIWARFRVRRVRRPARSLC